MRLSRCRSCDGREPPGTGDHRHRALAHGPWTKALVVSVKTVMRLLKRIAAYLRERFLPPVKTIPIEYNRNTAEDLLPQIVLAPVVPAAAVAQGEQQAMRQAAAGVDNADSLAVSDQPLAGERQIRSWAQREMAAVGYRYQQLIAEQNGIRSALLGRQAEEGRLEKKVAEARAKADKAEQELRERRGPEAVEATRSAGVWSRIMQWAFLIAIVVSEVIFNASALLVASFPFETALLASCGISFCLLVGASFTASQLAAGRRRAAGWMGFVFGLAGVAMAVSMAKMREEYVGIMEVQTTSQNLWAVVALGAAGILMPLACGCLEYQLFFGATLRRADGDLEHAVRALDAFLRQNPDLSEQIKHAEHLLTQFAARRDEETAVLAALGEETVDAYYVALQEAYGDPEMTTALDQRRAAADARTERAETATSLPGDGDDEGGTLSRAVA